jgi:pyridoxal phosphate enzyme (YggS family)
LSGLPFFIISGCQRKNSCFFEAILIFYKAVKMRSVEENIKDVWSRIERAAAKTRRGKEDIKLVAVTKTVEVERIKDAISYGIGIIGENRVQEAESKLDQITEKVEKHLVGHLQTNKAKKAVDLFDFIQSVDSLRIAQEISRRASQKGSLMPVLVEVNTSGEETKFGIEPDQVLPLMESISDLEGIRIKGLMTIGLFSDDPEDTRPCFRRLKAIFDQLKEDSIPNVEMTYLSMGMTSDFEVAIQEGSNMVRVGTAIFGARS